jgi:hypothetical protein
MLISTHLTGFGVNIFDPRRIGAALSVLLDAQKAGSVTLSGSACNDGDLIDTWVNQGFAGVGNAVQATGANQPKYRAAGLNGFPAVEGRHDGATASVLAIADHAGLNYTKFTLFSVVKRVTDLGADETVVAKYVTTGNQREFANIIVGASDRPRCAVSPDGTSTGAINVDAVVTTGTTNAFIVEARFNGSTLFVRHNGVTQGSGAIASIGNGTASYCLFARDTALTSPGALMIGENIFITDDVTDSLAKAIDFYLSRKWAIPLV